MAKFVMTAETAQPEFEWSIFSCDADTPFPQLGQWMRRWGWTHSRPWRRGLANFFCKGPGSKYFRLRVFCVVTTQLAIVALYLQNRH